MKDIIRLSESLLICYKDENNDGIPEYWSNENSEGWVPLSDQDPLIEKVKPLFDANKGKREFFNSYIGSKLRIDNDGKTGWLIIKAIDNITIRYDNEKKFYSVSYADIGYSINGYELSLDFHVVKEQPIDEAIANRTRYEKHIKDAEANHEPIKPLRFSGNNN